ncbi:MAG TPA: EscU/YscU/HrcU family type III secretion system export apparatus switch protein [Acetobacteraceae bacterium]|nr:EscU/YscU/HrcU family type III secretion system export apparatus switch protein [Acetobacteraceae bacterium]
MAETQQEDRTEAATPRRLQKAREEGQVPVSRELTSFAGLAMATLALVLLAPAVTHDLTRQLGVLLGDADDLSLATASSIAGVAWLRGAAPFVLATMIAGSVVVLIQTGFLLTARPLRIDFSRISPRAGLKRLFGPESLIEAAKSLAKIAIIGLVLWRVLLADLPALLLSSYGEPSQLLTRAAGPVLHVTLVVLAAQAAIAALDFFWVTLRHSRSLRMTRHDILEEQKETEGDPRVKARLKQIRTLRARRRMLAAVPKATVVITNPTHYAVALAYDRAKHAAPRVVAKGVDTLAARIREVAEASRVPLVANPPLARALFRVELDTDIPAEHYRAVAEIIAYVWRLGRRPLHPVSAP